MSNRLISFRIFVCGALLLFAGTLCMGQSNPYPEIEIYRSLVEKETRDSIYYKALTQYRTLPPPVARATELSELSEAFTSAFWHEPKNYSRAFVLAVELKQKLAGVNDTQFPGRRDAYVKLGEAYYIFKDFGKSVELLANVIGEPPLSFNDRSHLEALRISGICYANMPGGMDRSDSCFMAMLLCPDVVLGRPVYDALALSNLGCNAMMRGDFDKALALDLEVLSRLKQENDYGHIAGMYACQGFCYLGKGDYTGLRTVIDSISYYAHKDRFNRHKRLKQAYTLNGKYYAAVGDARTAQLYNDSLVALYQLEEREYTSQFISDAHREVSDREIALSKRRIARQRNLIAFVLVILSGILIVTMIIANLYRKRDAAYKVLSRKAEEWALENVAPNVSSAWPQTNRSRLRKEATEEDLRIMALADREMTENQAYRETGLTAESLADRLGIHRNALSHAVNHITSDNFSHYINGYRVKEAVRIISETDAGKLCIEQIYERVGFGNRNSFFRTFKQFTGLSPVEFHKIKG